MKIIFNFKKYPANFFFVEKVKLHFIQITRKKINSLQQLFTVLYCWAQKILLVFFVFLQCKKQTIYDSSDTSETVKNFGIIDDLSYCHLKRSNISHEWL
jgi:hypothetical protein